MTLEEQIKAKAIELGFDLVGITSAEPSRHTEYFKKWLADGYHAEMAYLARRTECRENPRQILPDAKSIIVVGSNYHTADPSPTGHQGKMARYALGEDYHEVMQEKLRKLVEAIQETVPSAQAKLYVDTGPILERELAQRAGLGWIGKNTVLYNRRFGQWLFLGEVLLNIELKADAPETRDTCGRCTRCIDACPTRAILAPRVLDSRRCISYLTIELKGSIPIELRPLIGNRIYGCDDCLEVCPWNRFAQQAHESAFTPPADLTAPELIELLSLTEEEFKRRFAKSPILRTKRRGLLRNVCVALGNSGDLRAIPALQRALDDPEPLVREHAAWALEQLKRP